LKIEKYKLLFNIVTISKENFVMRKSLSLILLFGLIITLGVQAEDLKIRSVMGSGGMVGSSNGTMKMSGIYGQLAIQTVSNSSNYDVNQGFWVPLGQDPTSVEDQQLSNTMLNNYPNPVTNFTTISYSVETTSHVTLKVFDLVGNVVAVLSDDVQQPGEKYIDWDARDDFGQDLTSGSYMYELTLSPLSMKGAANSQTYRNLMIIVR
jgi:hypothetical protein